MKSPLAGTLIGTMATRLWLTCFWSMLLWPAVSGSAASAPRFCSVDAWCSRNADNLPGQLKPAAPIELEGMINDWLTAAAAVLADQPADVTVALEGPAELTNAAAIKVVGEVPGPEKGGQRTWWLDPLLAAPAALGDLSQDIRNWPAIHDFPRLHLAAGQPVMLWLTIKTHQMPPGLWQGRLTIGGPGNAQSAMPIEVKVHPVKLPVDNPIIGYSYTSFRERRELARLALDYGINACGYYDNWDMCRQLGFKFYKFAIPFVNQQGALMDTKDPVVLKDGIEPIREVVARLHLRPEEWGIEIFDEPFDKNAWAAVAWMVRLRQLWPEARFWSNIGYANQGRNSGSVTNTVDPMKPYVNVWCPYLKYLEPSSADVLQAMRATGNPVWYYIVTFRHSRPPGGGWWMPWLAWKYHLAGWAFYSLDNYGQDAPGGPASQWTANACARVYPGDTPSLWLEGLRQGVQDYKRLWLLERRGCPRQDLDRLAETVVSFRDHINVGAKPAQCLAARRELDRLLLQLPPAEQ